MAPFTCQQERPFERKLLFSAESRTLAKNGEAKKICETRPVHFHRWQRNIFPFDRNTSIDGWNCRQFFSPFSVRNSRYLSSIFFSFPIPQRLFFFSSSSPPKDEIFFGGDCVRVRDINRRGRKRARLTFAFGIFNWRSRKYAEEAADTTFSLSLSLSLPFSLKHAG